VDGDTLREIQAQIKERYRAEHEPKLVTLHAEADLATSAVACSVQTGWELVEAGLALRSVPAEK
jgi:hypothetical protein